MVMLRRWFHLIMVMILNKMEFFNQAQSLQHLEIPVDGRKTETRLPFPGSAVNFIGIKVSLSLTNNFHN